MRLPVGHQDGFLAGSRGVLRAGLQSAGWITVDDTGALHRSANGFSTQIGNRDFTRFGTRERKSRRKFLDLSRAGQTAHVIDAAAPAHV
ncbi:MAG: IS66 family transposase, partial [Acetobacteraceae bacterium]